MKKISMILISVIILFSGCSMSRPDIKDYPPEMTKLEKKLQYRYDSCVYAQTFSKKVDLRCNEILNLNQKVYLILYYDLLKKEKKLPIIYRSKGNEPMTFDDFFKYVK